MGFLTSIFGGGETNIWTIIFALAIVIVLIVTGVWALKLVFKASGTMARGRQRRLAVIDTMAIDSKRHLVLIRRDDVEHLIITGNTNDVVIETGIPVPTPVSRTSSRDTTDQPNARIQPTMERATAAAQRLGLSSILRRKNEAAKTDGDKTDDDADADADQNDNSSDQQSPLDRLRHLGKDTQERTTPSLRHTGLLRPVSEMESVNLGASQDNQEPENNDSAMKQNQEVDSKAMESVEEGTSPEDADTEVETLNDNQEAGNKSS